MPPLRPTPEHQQWNMPVAPQVGGRWPQQDHVQQQGQQMNFPYSFGHDLGVPGLFNMQHLDGSFSQGFNEAADIGSGAETPELENEHPMSRQASAQVAADQLRGILGVSPEQLNARMAARFPQVPQSMPMGGLGKGVGADRHRENFRGDFMGEPGRNGGNDMPYMMVPGAQGDDGFRGSTGGSDDHPSPMQPYWALVVPPGAESGHTQNSGPMNMAGAPGGYNNSAPYMCGGMGGNNLPYGMPVMKH